MTLGTAIRSLARGRANFRCECFDGKLHAISSIGRFTIGRLRLNRPALIEHRQRKRQWQEQLHLLHRSHETLRLLTELQHQQEKLLREQQLLLDLQRKLLQMLSDAN